MSNYPINEILSKLVRYIEDIEGDVVDQYQDPALVYSHEEQELDLIGHEFRVNETNLTVAGHSRLRSVFIAYTLDLSRYIGSLISDQRAASFLDSLEYEIEEDSDESYWAAYHLLNKTDEQTLRIFSEQLSYEIGDEIRSVGINIGAPSGDNLLVVNSSTYPYEQNFDIYRFEKKVAATVDGASDSRYVLDHGVEFDITTQGNEDEIGVEFRV